LIESSKPQNIMLYELQKLFKLIWLQKKCCDYNFFYNDFFFFYSAYWLWCKLMWSCDSTYV